ncbi:MAG TPA: hypothetical protein VI565_08760, partial [Burkholderiales bacterium]|nr:hypothetical protein [Burkholderiales bacterium]
GASLVYGVRLPEELQAPAARIAVDVGASYAARALKDEWADVSMYFLEFDTVGDGWRVYGKRVKVEGGNSPEHR